MILRHVVRGTAPCSWKGICSSLVSLCSITAQQRLGFDELPFYQVVGQAALDLQASAVRAIVGMFPSIASCLPDYYEVDQPKDLEEHLKAALQQDGMPATSLLFFPFKLLIQAASQASLRGLRATSKRY